MESLNTGLPQEYNCFPLCWYSRQLKNQVVSTTNTGGGGRRQLLTIFIFLAGVWPTTIYFVIIQPGFGQLLSNLVIFYHQQSSHNRFKSFFLLRTLQLID